MLKYRVKYILNGKKLYRDLEAVSDFDARVLVTLARGYRENKNPKIKLGFRILGVQELPLNYPIEEAYNAVYTRLESSRGSSADFI